MGLRFSNHCILFLRGFQCTNFFGIFVVLFKVNKPVFTPPPQILIWAPSRFSTVYGSSSLSLLTGHGVGGSRSHRLLLLSITACGEGAGRVCVCVSMDTKPSLGLSPHECPYGKLAHEGGALIGDPWRGLECKFPYNHFNYLSPCPIQIWSGCIHQKHTCKAKA